MSDNSTSHMAAVYDAKIDFTIPYYSLFHKETISVVRTYNPAPEAWLDTGCGTGTLTVAALPVFPGTKFTMADPSPEMLAIAREKLSSSKGEGAFLQKGSQELDFPDESFDVITAIQSHHYFDRPTREKATANCCRMLKPGGIYVAFENIRPTTEAGTKLGLARWKEFQMGGGKSAPEAEAHVGRFDHEFFPITIEQHMDLLRKSGFSAVELLWASYMQAGFFAIK